MKRATIVLASVVALALGACGDDGDGDGNGGGGGGGGGGGKVTVGTFCEEYAEVMARYSECMGVGSTPTLLDEYGENCQLAIDHSGCSDADLEALDNFLACWDVGSHDCEGMTSIGYFNSLEECAPEGPRSNCILALTGTGGE